MLSMTVRMDKPIQVYGNKSARFTIYNIGEENQPVLDTCLHMQYLDNGKVVKSATHYYDGELPEQAIAEIEATITTQITKANSVMERLDSMLAELEKAMGDPNEAN